MRVAVRLEPAYDTPDEAADNADSSVGCHNCDPALAHLRYRVITDRLLGAAVVLYVLWNITVWTRVAVYVFLQWYVTKDLPHIF